MPLLWTGLYGLLFCFVLTSVGCYLHGMRVYFDDFELREMDLMILYCQQTYEYLGNAEALESFRNSFVDEMPKHMLFRVLKVSDDAGFKVSRKSSGLCCNLVTPGNHIP